MVRSLCTRKPVSSGRCAKWDRRIGVTAQTPPFEELHPVSLAQEIAAARPEMAPMTAMFFMRPEVAIVRVMSFVRQSLTTGHRCDTLAAHRVVQQQMAMGRSNLRGGAGAFMVLRRLARTADEELPATARPDRAPADGGIAPNWPAAFVDVLLDRHRPLRAAPRVSTVPLAAYGADGLVVWRHDFTNHHAAEWLFVLALADWRGAAASAAARRPFGS
jgi:hypothetical protein